MLTAHSELDEAKEQHAQAPGDGERAQLNEQIMLLSTCVLPGLQRRAADPRTQRARTGEQGARGEHTQEPAVEALDVRARIPLRLL